MVRDTAIGLPPLNELLARDQMARTRVWRLLQGYRGKPAAAIATIAEVLIRVGQIAADLPEISELDINPLLADADGVIALDARMRVAPAEPPGAARLAIAPYPAELVSLETLRDGTTVQLRPIRPEDEPLVHDLVAHMSAEDLRLRFFTPIRSLSHRFAARLTQIDYDREMALVAVHGGTVLGIARYSADPDRERAEYAVAVRTDWHGRGVGTSRAPSDGHHESGEEARAQEARRQAFQEAHRPASSQDQVVQTQWIKGCGDGASPHLLFLGPAR